MNAMLLRAPAAVETGPLQRIELPPPEPATGEIVVRIEACGVCHTDLHVVEGDIHSKLPIIPGHQIVGTDVASGGRVGIPWLHWTCGQCEFCRSGRENLCERAQFTGFDVHGGFAEFVTVPAEFAVPLPVKTDAIQLAPLLCAGIIGYRALRLALNLDSRTDDPRAEGAASSGPLREELGMAVGLYGFGASAHIAIQIARHLTCEVFVATRGADHQRLASEMGAAWVGRAEDLPSDTLHSAIIFAPAGTLVPEALRALRRGGTLALAGIYMSPIPELPYDLIYHERTIRSVANATRQDARELMKVAEQIPVQVNVEPFPLSEANRALLSLKRSEIRGAGVLVI
jgi:propanol-preferring alcohol dehydrogenase